MGPVEYPTSLVRYFIDFYEIFVSQTG